MRPDEQESRLVVRKPSEFAVERPEAVMVPFGPYRAVVKYWVDGDTGDFLTDLGLNQYAYVTVRVTGINAAEIYGKKEPGDLERGQAALAFALELAPVGTPVVIDTDKDKASFGRFIARITLPDGRDFGEEMVAAGHAEWSEQ